MSTAIRALLLSMLIALIINPTVSKLYAKGKAGGLYVNNKLNGRVNPLGTSWELQLFYRFSFGNKSLLWENSHLDLGFSNILSPAAENVNIYMQLEPIAFFDLTLQTGIIEAFDVFQYGIPRLPVNKSATDPVNLKVYPHGDSDFGYWLNIAPRLKAKLGPIIVANVFTFYHYHYQSIHAKTIYNYSLDIRMKPVESVYQNSLYLLYEINPSFLIGFNLYSVFNPDNKNVNHCLNFFVNHSWNILKSTKLSATLLTGYYLKNENYDWYFALQLAFNTKL